VAVLKPRWTSASFLLYLGLFTIVGAMAGAYGYLAGHYGSFAFVGWTLLMLAILLVLAVFLRRRGPWLAGGVFAYLAVAAFATFVGAVFEWWGWGGTGRNATGPFDGWHWVLWLLLLIVLAATVAALRATKFPLLVISICTIVWFVVTDIISGGGSWSAVVTLLFGIAYFFAGLGINRVYGFWVQFAAAALVSGSLLYWWHSSTADWWLIAVAGVIYVGVGTLIRRSVWTVFGALGLLAAATHFSIDWTTGNFSFFTGPTRVWVPIVVAAALGFVYVVLGLWASRRTAVPD
jgi:hypothetical protein